MSHQYPNPPLVEAIIDFKFKPGPEWNILIPGRMYDRVGQIYSVQEPVYPDFPPRIQSLYEARGFPFVDRIRLKASDDSRLLQIARDRLVFNQLQPYPGWDTLKPNVLGLLDDYIDIAKPQGFIELSIRYINQINVPDHREVADLFAFGPVVQGPLAARFGTFSLNGTFTYDDGDKLEVELVAINPTEGNLQTFVLDLDYSASPDHLPTLDHVSGWLDLAHEQIEQAFEQIIRDPVRSLMSRGG